MEKRILVCGAGGFIGGHLVKRLRNEGYWVRGVDLKRCEFSPSVANEFIVGDLRDPEVVLAVLAGIDEVYQLAADMGGAGYIFTGEHDANVMHNSATINLNVLELGRKAGVKKFFYSSSACIYPAYNQTDPDNPKCSEDSAYPAAPDSEYGWEKLFSERLYAAYQRNHGIEIRIARFHNIFGPEGTWRGGREKAPAAICRKVAETPNHGEIEIWGDGKQTRSFLYVDECVEGIRRLMESNFSGPVNLGSEEMVTINQLAEMAMEIASKQLRIRHIEGPLGVRGRNSDNRVMCQKLGWVPSASLREGLKMTYSWVAEQVSTSQRDISLGIGDILPDPQLPVATSHSKGQEGTPPLTIFAIPKAFRGHTGVIQRNAILSWNRLRPKPEIILFGNDEGTAQIAQELGLRHAPNIRCSEFGTPLLDDIFAQAQSLARSNLVCYINSDILVFGNFMETVRQVSGWRVQFLMVGRRRNVDLDEPEIYSSPDQELRLRELVSRQNLVSSLGAMDYFVFPRGLFRVIPPFTPAQGLWDNWLVWKALSSKVAVVDASQGAFVVHQNHPKSAAVAYGGEEGRRNRELAGNRTRTMEDATHRLTSTGIGSNFRQKLLRRTRNFRHALGFRRDSIDRFMSRLGLARS
jgi:GDP-D-mannose 3',5'-epimerase